MAALTVGKKAEWMVELSEEMLVDWTAEKTAARMDVWTVASLAEMKVDPTAGKSAAMSVALMAELKAGHWVEKLVVWKVEKTVVTLAVKSADLKVA